jgi:hypothetical protein
LGFSKVLESVLFFTCGVLTMERHASMVKSVSQKHKGKEKLTPNSYKEGQEKCK